MTKKMKTQVENAKIIGILMFLTLVIALFAVGLVSAEVPADYRVRYGIIEDDLSLTTTDNALSGHYVKGYVCANADCTQIGSQVTSLTGYNSGELARVVFPTNLVSVNGYVLYFYKQDYIGWEQTGITIHGTSSTPVLAPSIVYLSQKRNGFAPIVNLQATNKVNPGEPITINMDVGIDSQTASALQRATVSNIPLEEEVETRVTVEIFNNQGLSIHSESMLVDIDYSDVKSVEFNYVFNTPGVYTIKLYTDVTDAKIINSIRQEAEVQVTVGNEIVSPVVQINNPVNGDTYDTTALNLEVSASQAINTWAYVLNGIGPIAFTPGALINAREGSNTLIVFGTNVNGTGTDSVVFNVDTGVVQALIVQINNPVDGQTYDTTQLVLSASANQVITSWTYSLNGFNKGSFTPGQTINCVEGQNIIRVTGSNANGQGIDSVTFVVNTSQQVTKPTVTIRNPAPGSSHNSTNLNLEVSSDQVINTWEYVLNNGTRTTFVPGQVIQVINGQNTLTVYGTNENGTDYDMSIFYVDTTIITPLEITVTSPINGQVYSNPQIPLNVYANKPVESWRYSLNNKPVVWFTPNTTINAQEGENVLVVFGYADGRMDFERVIFYVDSNQTIQAPVITVHNPIQDVEYDDDNINLEVSANQVIDTWTYILNNGSVNVFTPNTTINAQEGENVLVVFGTNENGTGSYTVRFYVDTDNGDDDDDDNGHGTGGLLILEPSDVLVNPGMVGNETSNYVFLGEQNIEKEFPWLKCLVYILVFLIVIALILIALALAKNN